MTLYEALSHRFHPPGSWSPRGLPSPSALGAAAPTGTTDRTDSYARTQHERTLTLAIWITMATGASLAAVNLIFLDWESLISLSALIALCPMLLELSSRGRGRLAGGILIALILAVATYNLLEGGGLKDPGVVAFPIIVVLGGMLLGKRSLPWLVLMVITALAAITAIDWFDVGPLAVGEAGDRPTTLQDLLAVSVLIIAAAMVVWVSMDNTERNILRVRRSQAKVSRAYEDTLEAWARALEYRDRETEGHSRRVTELSVALARELDIHGDELTSIRWGSLLHDVGKLAIPDAVLLKPGPLTEHERALMELHPVYAREMLSRIPFLHPVMAIPYHHHERWDGTGYPEGLAGEEIPLAARIFSVVDQWEALSSDRPYRRAWPRERIVAYLEENAGRIFDARIVEVFLRSVAPRS